MTDNRTSAALEALYQGYLEELLDLQMRYPDQANRFEAVYQKYLKMEEALSLVESRIKSWSVRPGEDISFVPDTIRDALAFDLLSNPPPSDEQQ